MQTNISYSESSHAPLPVTWLEPATTKYRVKWTAVSAGVTLLLVGLIALMQVKAGEADGTAIAWMIGFGVLGGFVCYCSPTVKTIRKFQNVEVHLTRWQRLRFASPWLLLGFGGITAFGAIYWKF